MKRLPSYFLILAINVISWIIQCGPVPVGTTTGGSEVWGKVVDTNGIAISNAEILLCLLNGKDSVVSIKQKFSNAEGIYGFDTVDRGNYLIRGDGLNKKLVLLRLNITYPDTGDLNLGTDVMKAPGSVVCVFNGAKKGELDGVSGFIPKSPYFGFVNNDSLEINRIYPGKYTLKIPLAPLNYFPVVIDTLNILSNTVTVINVDIERDTTGAPPAPEKLEILSFDTLNGIARIAWNPVPVRDIDGYYVHSGFETSDLSVVSDRTPDTVFSLPLKIDSAGNAVVTYMQVESVDKKNQRGNKSGIITIQAPSPNLVKTFVTDTLILVNQGNQLFRGDTAYVKIAFSNTARNIDSVIWAVAKDDSIVKKTSYNICHQGQDSLRIVWGWFNELYVTISIYDNSGNVKKIDRVLTGTGMYPPNTWKVLPAKLPTPRQFLTVVSVGEKIITLGGVGTYYDMSTETERLKIFDIVETFNPDGSVVFDKSTMFSACSEHASVVYNGKVYSVGGNTANKDSVSKIEVYDPVTGLSKIFAVLTEKISGAAVCITGSRLIIIGGKRTIAGVSRITGSIDVFDLSLPASSAYRHNRSLIVPRMSHSAVVCDSKIYVLGGIDSSTENSLNSVEIVDITNGTIGTGTGMNSPRCKFAAVSISGKIVVFGGYVRKNTAITDVEVFDYTSGEGIWKNGQKMSSARYGTAAVVHNDAIFLLGGATVNSNGSLNYQSDIEIYYP